MEQAYTFYRTDGSILVDFLKWVEEEKRISCEKISLGKTRKLIEEYTKLTRNVKNNDLPNNVHNNKLTEHEEKIISFYRNGTEEQRKLIDAIIMKM